MLSERSILLNDYINKNTIEKAISCNSRKNAVATPSQGTDLTIKPISSAAAATAAAAAAYIYLEKVKNERMSPQVTVAQLDLVKDAVTESPTAKDLLAAAIVEGSHKNNYSKEKNNGNINDRLVNKQVQSHTTINSSNNNASNAITSHSMTQSCNQSQQEKHQLQNQAHRHLLQLQQQHLTLQMSSNHVKAERLSPGTNGDFQISISRSRSTTPSSFRETSPQNSVQSSPSETLTHMHNLSTSILSNFHQAAVSSHHENLRASPAGITSPSAGLPSDFSKRNYSDFMRSLAAKYNNENPNENLKRNFVYEAVSSNTSFPKKSLTASQKTTYAPTPSTPLSKDDTIPATSSLPPTEPLTAVTTSPGESANKLSHHNKSAAAAATAAAGCSSNTSPYIAPFLSTIPGIFPPLIDMSSTQALITLARAAQESEIHSILNVSSKNPKKSADNTSPSPSPSLNMALQQAAQFISPALICSIRLQKQQQQHSQIATQSSPRLANTSNTFSKISRNQGYKVNISPLDLTAQPPAVKRFKAESTSSQSSTDALIPIATIARRASSSTVTTSPSPPPTNENSFNTSSTNIAQLQASCTPFLIDSGTNTEETTIATKITSSTSAPAAAISRQCQAQSEELNSWTVNDVCAFVSSIDICAEYVERFRDQCIDGAGLPLLTEDHLVNSLGMKLGPALKLRSVLAKRLGGPCPCVSCVSQAQQMFALQTSGTAATAAESTVANDSKSSCNSHLTKSLFSDKSALNCNSHTSNINSSSKMHDIMENVAANSAPTISKNSTTTKCCDKDATTTDSTTTRNNNNFMTIDDITSSSSPQLGKGKLEETILQQQQHPHLHKQPSPPKNVCNNPASA